ncbi:hypothetical protein BDDG_07645 [Blastomyces dermatitidis ATCC 18188]|uniref:Uncharacterized protein n=1 Tax=Ajellomyces dermatitidis (strain ATCC 18188 / CBS 674.68) TaxID=653446 RepID=F2TN87_AJEDA|nr:hypothetical protein BDDG_07645 [Blastomyces dermatitidis ATCC 18188]
MTVDSGIPSILKALLRVSPDLLRVHRMDVHTATRSFHSSPTPINNELLQQTTGTLDNAYEDGLIRSVSVGPGSVQQPTAPNSTSEKENSVPEDEMQSTTGAVLSETCSSNSSSPPSPRAQRLLQKIKEKLNNICQFLKHSPHNIVEGFFENLRSEDCRLGHIKSITGKHTPEPKERFIQCLAQRSLALDFHQWESNLQQAGSTRLDDVSRILSSARSKNGNFRHYVEHVARFIDIETAYIALKRGTKQLAVENVCNTSGIEIAISFVYGSFDALTYLDIHNFCSLLKDQKKILDTLKKVSCWVELSQSTYNGCRQNKRRCPESPQSRSSSYAARRRRLVPQPRIIREIRPRFSGGTAARVPNDTQNSENPSAPNLHPPEMDYPDSTALYGTDGNLPRYQTRNSPSSCQSSGLDSLANAATNLSHSLEAVNPGRRDNGSGSYNTNIEQPMPSRNYCSESYNTNIEQSMPSQDYPQSTEEHPISPFDPSVYMEMGTLPSARGVEHPTHPFDPSSYMQIGTLPYDDEAGRSTTPFDPSMYMQNGIHANGNFGKYTINHISISHAICKRRIYPISMLTVKFYPHSITSIKPTAVFIPDEY